MKLTDYAMYLPDYTIGPNAYDKIPEICAPYGRKALVIGGRKAMAAAKEKLGTALKDFDVLGWELYGTDCTYAAVEHLRAMPVYAEAEIVFAVGGGKATDTVKCLCLDDGKPVFALPTITSNCAATTAVSIMYKEDGSFLHPHFFARPPHHCFIDTKIIAASPAQYMWAGIGDTYAKYYEATISSRGEALPHYTEMGVAVSRMCLEPLMRCAEKGLTDHRAGVNSDEVEQVILAINVSTGLASNFLTRDHTPDYNSGLAHAIFYALTSYPVIEERHLHGEVVAFGVLFALLVDGWADEFRRIHDLNRRIGLPTKLSDIEITEEQFREVITRIPAMGDIRHYPYRVTEEMMMDAWKQLDAYNAGLDPAEERG